jgi:hypothetical protein
MYRMETFFETSMAVRHPYPYVSFLLPLLGRACPPRPRPPHAMGAAADFRTEVYVGHAAVHGGDAASKPQRCRRAAGAVN